MKKLLSTLLSLALIAGCAGAVSAERSAEMPASSYLESNGRLEYVSENEFTEFYSTDTGTDIVVNMLLDALIIYNPSTFGDYFAYDATVTYMNEPSPVVQVDYTTGVRYDSGEWTEMSPEDGELKYMNSGTTFRFLKPGNYRITFLKGFTSEEEKAAYIAENGGIESAPLYGDVTIEVVGEELSLQIDGTPDEEYAELPGYEDYADYIEPDISDEPAYFDESRISISGITSFDYGTVAEGWYTANCSLPAAITAQKDLKNFTVVKLDDPSVNEFDGELAEYDGEIKFTDDGYISAEIGAAYKITEPGSYYVWYDDYDGYFEGIYIYAEDDDAALDALYTSSRVMVNGTEVNFEAYNINGNNYFKLRDIAAAINGTDKNFEVSWDAENSRINLLSSTPYTVAGGELSEGDGTNKIAGKGTSDISIDGKAVLMKAYLINNNNYFKLRDLGKLFNFGVEWDGENNCIMIVTSADYIE